MIAQFYMEIKCKSKVDRTSESRFLDASHKVQVGNVLAAESR
jgi:hypothetical protein